MSKTTVIHVAGWKACSFYQKTANAIQALAHIYPTKISADIKELPDRDSYRQWLFEFKEVGSEQTFRESLGERAAKHTSSPFVWKNENTFIGGCDDTFNYIRTNITSSAAESGGAVTHRDEDEGSAEYDYDLVVIGGGSGGLACSKEAANLGKKVCVLDYVKPSPIGSEWGLGGTCVNVGCIPKKLMHQGSLLGELMRKDAAKFGWKQDGESKSEEDGEGMRVKHDWNTLVQSVQDYIHSLNFKYRVELRNKKVKYENLLGKFIDPHTLECTNEKKKKTSTITARRFVIAVGGRPRPLSIPGGEHAISSDDIFQLDRAPGKTIVIGASYVALECAGFLRGMGYDVTILVRSILLRGFDQDMAERIGNYMKEEGVEFQRGVVPHSIEKLENGQFKVSWCQSQDKEMKIIGHDIVDTVLNASGRDPDVKKLGLEAAGVELNPKTGRIMQINEQTNVPHVYAIGDVIDAPELTPVAIQAGRLLAKRLYNGSKEAMDYSKICTTVFTPIEYGCCGLSEEDAMEKYGENLEVYHQNFTPLEWSLSDDRTADVCYVKLLCDKADSNRVVGFHYLGPNAGEVTQAVGIAVRMNATYDDFINTVGIHPTTAEVFTTLEITKSSGKEATGGGC